MDGALTRPWICEVEDYQEYKRLRQLAREKQSETAKAKRNENLPALTVSSDGTMEVFEDDTAETPFQHKFSDTMLEDSCPSDTPLQEISPYALRGRRP